MTTIYLHIGQAKTGTTALQHFLGNNYELLKEQGVLYPQSVMLKNRSHHPLILSLWHPPYPGFVEQIVQYPADHYYKLLRQEIEKEGLERVVLSSEMFEVRRDEHTLSEIKRQLSGFDIKVVVYVRNQAQSIQAHYNTNIKTYPFYTGTIRQYMNEYADMLDSYSLVDAWASVFGKENMVVRVYEKSQLKNGINGDFLDVLGMEFSDDFVTATENTQHSISRDSMEFLRFINRLPMEPYQHQKVNLAIRDAFIHLDDTSAFKTHGMITASEQSEFMQRFAEGNEKLARQYLHRSDGRLFSEEAGRCVQKDEYLGLPASVFIERFQKFYTQRPEEGVMCVAAFVRFLENMDKKSNSRVAGVDQAVKDELHAIQNSLRWKVASYIAGVVRRIISR